MKSKQAPPPHQNPDVIEAATASLIKLSELCPSLTIAVLLTDDGSEIARTPGPKVADQRMASVASSLHVLSEAVSNELRLGSMKYAIIEASGSRVVLRRVPKTAVVLAAVFGGEETVGLALNYSRQVADELSEQLAAFAL